MDIGFAPNHTHLYELDITPFAVKRTFARIGAGIATIDGDPSEEIDQTAYYDGDGNASSDVTGGQEIISVSGHRRHGDPYQDYVASLKFVRGEARKSTLRITDPAGEVVESSVTICNIKALGANGDANSKNEFSNELHFNGAPRVIPPDATVLPESVTATVGAVAVGKTVAATATVTPSSASDRCVFAIENDEFATVDSEGNVTGVKAGKTRLSVKCAAKPSVCAVVDVTVGASA